MFYTYILLSLKDKERYVGYTKDLKKRIKEHIKGLVESTRNRRPIELIYYEACLNEDDARKREKYLKTKWGFLYIEKRLKGFYKKL